MTMLFGPVALVCAPNAIESWPVACVAAPIAKESPDVVVELATAPVPIAIADEPWSAFAFWPSAMPLLPLTAALPSALHASVAPLPAHKPPPPPPARSEEHTSDLQSLLR